MWRATTGPRLGLAGASVGVFGGGIANRHGLRGPLAVMVVLVLTAAAPALLVALVPPSRNDERPTVMRRS